MHFPKSIPLLVFGAIALVAAAQAPTPPFDFDQPVDLATARELALNRDPVLARWEHDAEAADGQIEQASLAPNPVIGAEVENILGTGPFQGIDGHEFTLGLSQVLETAGKRQRRTEFAERERVLLDWERADRRTAVVATVNAAFVEVLLAQQALDLHRERLALAEQAAGETARLVKAARAPTVDQTRAQLAVKQEQFALAVAERALVSARNGLAALWGIVPAPEFGVRGELQLEDPAPLAELVQRLPSTARLGRFEAIAAQRTAALELEKARAKPDVEVTGAVRYFREGGGDGAFLLGVQVPWPLRDRNQGNIRSARARLAAVSFDREATRRALLVDLAAAHRELTNAFVETQSMEAELLPAAEQTLADTQTGYDRGQFTLLSVLDSRRALFEVREARLDALRRYSHSLATIESLTTPAQLSR